MLVKNPEFGVWDDLVVYGRQDDGTPYIASILRACVTLEDGSRYVHNHIFKTARLEEDEEGYPFYVPQYVEAKLLCEQLIDRMEGAVRSGVIDLDMRHWHQTFALYGSKAWHEELSMGDDYE